MVMPQALGYVSLPSQVSAASVEQEINEARQALTDIARREGYVLAGIFTDRHGRTENGLYALLDALNRGEAKAVVVPSLDDLRHVGCLTGASLPTAARYLRARLITLDDDS